MTGTSVGEQPKRPTVSRILLVLVSITVLAAAEHAAGAEIVDQRGRHIELAKPAERVVFLPMPAPAMYIAIDGTDRHIAAMNPSSKIAMRDGLLGRLFPRTAQIPTDVVEGASFVPNIESILALHPDAVFQWANVGTDAIGALDRAGLGVFAMRNGTQQDLVGAIDMMGKVSGKEARARTLIEMQAAREAKIKAALADLPDSKRPSVLYLSRVSEGLAAAGPGSYNDFTIRLAGGRNVAATSGTGRVVTFEQILGWNPDVILLGNFDAAMPANLYKDPRWSGATAVRAHRVYRMPLGGYRWDPPSQESALAWTWLLDILHPDKRLGDLRGDMQTWYRFLYGHDLTQDEIDHVLFLSENGASAGYGQFARQ